MSNHSVVKWHDLAKMFVIVDYVREMTAKKSSKYGVYGLFEPLLLLLYIVVSCLLLFLIVPSCALVCLVSCHLHLHFVVCVSVLLSHVMSCYVK